MASTGKFQHENDCFFFLASPLRCFELISSPHSVTVCLCSCFILLLALCLVFSFAPPRVIILCSFCCAYTCFLSPCLCRFLPLCRAPFGSALAPFLGFRHALLMSCSCELSAIKAEFWLHVLSPESCIWVQNPASPAAFNDSSCTKTLQCAWIQTILQKLLAKNLQQWYERLVQPIIRFWQQLLLLLLLTMYIWIVFMALYIQRAM